MTQKIFWQDPYLAELDAGVSRVSDDAVWLDRTIIYAESGGQESDAATIAGHPVLAAAWQGREIRYTLPAGHGLRASERVQVRIDWSRRYRLMRLHFAAELVLELVCRAVSGIEKIGAHIGADKARIDFRWPQSLAPVLPDLAHEAQAIVDADQAIESAFSDRERERRYWKIDGFARVPCGGTHLRRTGEIGTIGLRRRNPGRDKERIEVVLG